MQHIEKYKKSENKNGASSATASVNASPLIDTAKISNDSLYNDLEARYGSVFAQWVVDRLR